MTINLKQPLHEWAQALIAVLDTTGLQDNADILRVLFADCDGHIQYNQIIQPQRLFDPNTAYTGLSEEQLLQSPTLASCWDDIMCYLSGNVVAGFPIEWVVARFRENAAHYGLPIIPIVDMCLQRRAQAYFGLSGRLSLQSACERAGLAFPRPAYAGERAQALCMLLQAISENRKAITADTDLGALADRPF